MSADRLHGPSSVGGTLLRGATVLALALVAGCSTSSEGSPPKVTPEAVCPNAVATAIGAPCQVEGLTCAPQYTCGIEAVTITCICTNGAFSCVDVGGSPLAKGSTPGCPDSGTPETCPSTAQMANLTACSEIGLECQYPSTCDAEPEYETCQCALGQLDDGTMGMRFECTDVCSPPIDGSSPVQTATPPGDGGPDASTDAGVDAPFDSADTTDDAEDAHVDASKSTDAADE